MTSFSMNIVSTNSLVSASAILPENPGKATYMCHPNGLIIAYAQLHTAKCSVHSQTVIFIARCLVCHKLKFYK